MTAQPRQFVNFLKRWRHRFAVAILVIIALGILSRLIIIILLPPVIRHVAESFGLNAQYEKMELYLLNGDVGIWHFSLLPAEGGNSLLQSDYTRCHVSTLDLLRGKLTVRRLETEGVSVLVERNADGTIPLLQRFAPWLNKFTPTSGSSGSLFVPRSIDLASPLEIDAFRLTSVHAHVIDRAVSPALDTHVDLNLRLTDLASQERPTHFEMELTSSPILDLLHVEGTGTANNTALDAIFHAQVRGLHPQPAAGYLRIAGVRPTADSIGLDMNARITITAAATRPGAIAARLDLDNLSATSDGQQAASLDKVSLQADEIDLQTAHIAQVDITGGRCNLRRDPNGEIGVAGLQIVRPVVLVQQLSIPLSKLLKLIPQNWGVNELDLHDIQAKFHDDSVIPAADLAVDLKDLELGHFSPDKPDADTTIRGQLSAPGIAGNIRLDGRFKPFAAKKDIDLKLAADGIRPDALRPYLDQFGMDSDYAGGKFSTTFHADVMRSPDGTVISNANLSNTVLSDTSQILAFKSAAFSDAEYQPTTGLLHIKSVQISGPQLAVRRVVSGAISALGLHGKAVSTSGSSLVSEEFNGEEPFPEPHFDFSVNELRVDQFIWNDVGLQFDDQALVPSVTLALSDAGLELDDFDINFAPGAPATKSSKLHAWLHAPNLVQSVEVNGTVNNTTSSLDADLSIDGVGVSTEKIAGYFQGRQIQPILRDGEFHLITHLAIDQTQDGITSSLAVQNLDYRDGDDELLAVDSALISGAAFRGSELKVNQFAIHSPRLSIARDADGSFRALGVRISKPKSNAPASDRLARIYQTRSAAAASTTSWNLPIQFTLGDFDLENAGLDWTDLVMQPPVQAHLTSSVAVQNLVFGKPAPPAKLSIVAREDHALDGATISGFITPSLTSPSAQLDITATGIRGGTLGVYLEPYAFVDLQDGRFSASLDAAANQNPAGGFGGHVLVQNLDFHDAKTGENLCRLDALRLSASRVDFAGKIIAIDEIGVDALEAGVTRQKDGAIRTLGLTLGEFSQAKSPAPANSPAPSGPDVNAVSVANLAAVANEKYPLVKLRKLDINLRKISLRDETMLTSAPLVLSNMQFTNRTPIQLLGENPATCPPMDLQLNGAVDPLVTSVDIHALLSPFAQPALLSVTLNLSGIRGQGITDLAPNLAPEIDGTSLTNGKLTGQITLQITRQITDPLDFDLSKDFGLDLSVKSIRFTDGTSGATLASLDELSSDDIRVQPRLSTVVIGDLEISNPAATIYRDRDGVHLFGLVAKPAVWHGLAPYAASVASKATAALPTSTGEVAINKLVIEGLNFNFTDRTCDPQLIVPLNGLDLEVRGLSTKLATEEKSCQFSLLLDAGKVPVPKQSGGGIEQRDLFSQIEASGIVTLYPQLKGWVKYSVSALDLAALDGEARQLGIDLNRGTFDSSVDIRLNSTNSADLSAQFVLTDLQVSEPPNGPIVRYLNFGGPLNTLIAAREDQDGSITVPVDVAIRTDHLTASYLATTARGAAIGAVAGTVASTPLAMAESSLNFFGGEKRPGVEQPIVLQFAQADHSLSSQSVQQISALLQRMKDDQTIDLTLYHQLSAGDQTQAAIRANPSAQDCLNLAYNLRQKKFALLAARAAASDRAAAQLASGFGSDANAAIAQLQQIDATLATTEDALDGVYDMLRPGAGRQADRRTRGACLQIGQDRLLAVRAALLASHIPGIDQRIKLTHASLNVSPGNSGGQVVIELIHKKGG